jgi:hypothetical protein
MVELNESQIFSARTFLHVAKASICRLKSTAQKPSFVCVVSNPVMRIAILVSTTLISRQQCDDAVEMVNSIEKRTTLLYSVDGILLNLEAVQKARRFESLPGQHIDALSAKRRYLSCIFRKRWNVEVISRKFAFDYPRYLCIPQSKIWSNHGPLIRANRYLRRFCEPPASRIFNQLPVDRVLSRR